MYIYIHICIYSIYICTLFSFLLIFSPLLSLGAPRSRWLQSHFFQSLKRSLPGVSVCIHKTKCARCDGDSGVAGWDMGVKRRKRLQTGIFLSLLRQNCRQCLYKNLATVDVLEHRPWLLVRFETSFQSQWGVYIYIYIYSGNIYQSFFASAEISSADWRVTGFSGGVSWAMLLIVYPCGWSEIERQMSH